MTYFNVYLLFSDSLLSTAQLKHRRKLASLFLRERIWQCHFRQSQPASKAKASSGMRAFIAAKKAQLREGLRGRSSIPEIEVQESGDAGRKFSPERTFDGGFFTIRSPFPQRRLSPSRMTRSAGA